MTVVSAKDCLANCRGIQNDMRRGAKLVWLTAGMMGFLHLSAFAQIDPSRRQLLQIGYDAPFVGHAPLAGYVFYYLNHPEFYRDDLTVRMAIAPVYFDSELGLAHALGPNTDLGFGVAGGGFADSYNEVRRGNYLPKESFDGHGGSAALSLYHRFNPNQRVPLYGVLRGGVHYATYTDRSDTDRRFQLPDDFTAANFRVGLRLGGKEPVLFPSLAMELSVWAESLNRGNSGRYGFNGDRDVRTSAELLYAHAYLAYTFDRGDNFAISTTWGSSVNADRFSAYRLGGVLPLVAEYPLVIPGYYFQELSADQFLLFNGQYALSLGEKKRWKLTAMAATAVVHFIDGHEQPGNWHSGVGGGIAYESASEVWKAGLNYGFGIDARREGARGAHVITFVLQFDLERYLNKQSSRPFPWGFF
jgi:hypothetical protein